MSEGESGVTSWGDTIGGTTTAAVSASESAACTFRVMDFEVCDGRRIVVDSMARLARRARVLLRAEGVEERGIVMLKSGTTTSGARKTCDGMQ